ncbi:hypothetical protein BDN72DRAFT_854518 [Pluteus cervinus]|uniref:Uncharacterized protein n=1 Tax=Pluteus cervinus TaxID=181527 RepID=A0ACD3B7Y5_9AGAR|nr:hypothetical protein BDN72DRAFT_854518 [Pluteus cervinus]
MAGRDSATNQSSNDNNASNIRGDGNRVHTGSNSRSNVTNKDRYYNGSTYNGSYTQNNGIQNNANSGGSISIGRQNLNQGSNERDESVDSRRGGWNDNKAASAPASAPPPHQGQSHYPARYPPPPTHPEPYPGHPYPQNQFMPPPNSYPPPLPGHAYGGYYRPEFYPPHGYGNQFSQPYPPFPQYQPQPQTQQHPPPEQPQGPVSPQGHRYGAYPHSNEAPAPTPCHPVWVWVWVQMQF